MQPKTYLITGATSGLGLATAKALAKEGGQLLLIARNEEKAKAAMEKIKKEASGARLGFFTAGLSSQQQIREMAAEVLEQYPVIDVLINNAGTWFSERRLTEDGIETVFAVNHLSYFLLTHLLYPALRKADDGRIINVGSDSHFRGKMHFDDLNLTRNYHGLRSYEQSKLANVLFTYELDRRKAEDHISTYCVQPGLVQTDIGVKHTKWLHRIAWKFRRTAGVPPEEGAKTQIYLATADEVADESGKYWDDCRPKPSSKLSYREEDAARLWEISKELCDIEDFFHP